MIEVGESARLILEGLRSSLKKKIEILENAINDLKTSGKQAPEDIVARKERFKKELEELKK